MQVNHICGPSYFSQVVEMNMGKNKAQCTIGAFALHASLFIFKQQLLCSRVWIYYIVYKNSIIIMNSVYKSIINSKFISGIEYDC